MALKKLGVPTEFLVYPGQPHGSQEPRFHLVKMMAELGWFERWARGSGEWLDWAAILRDGDRMAKMDWSGAGHMTNKIITFTDRFKAAPSGAGAGSSPRR